jgi:tetratricopeptide (TPR) repeat protein
LTPLLIRFLDAERDATSCLALKPKHPKALFRRALARKSLVNLTGAREDLQEALKIEPTNEAIRAEIQQVEALQEALDREDAIKKERQAQLRSRGPASPRGPKMAPSKETLAAVVQSTGDDSFMRPVSTRRLDAKAAKPAVSSFSAAKEAREARLAGVEPRSPVKAAAAPAPKPLARAPPAESVPTRQPARPIKTAYDLVNQWREAKTDSEPATAFWTSLEVG